MEDWRKSDRMQKDTMERDQASQRRDGVEVQQWYNGEHSYCTLSKPSQLKLDD